MYSNEEFYSKYKLYFGYYKQEVGSKSVDLWCEKLCDLIIVAAARVITRTSRNITKTKFRGP